MAVTLTGGDGLFDRFGVLFDLVKKIRDDGAATSHQGEIGIEIDDIMDEYNNDRDLATELVGSTVAWKKQSAAIFPTLATIARRTIVEMVEDDNQQPDDTVRTAMLEMIRQMDASSDSIDGSVVTITDAKDAGNSGDGQVDRRILVAPPPPTVDADALLTSQNGRPEDIVCECIKDAQVSGTAGRETFSIKGEKRITDIRDPLWPGGSGISGTIRVTDPSENTQRAIGKQALKNGDLATYTVTDTPDSWSINGGVAGTNFGEEGTITHRKSKAFRFIGTGAAVADLSQLFDGTTAAKLEPNTVYGISVRVRAESGVLAGVIRFAVKDGSDNIINNTNAGITITASGISTGSWDFSTTAFITPAALPSGLKIVIEETTGITSGKDVYAADLVVWKMARFGGPSGPHITILPGATAWKIQDRIVFTVANGYEGEIGFYSDMLLDLYDLGLQFPNNLAGAETVADTEIA